MRAERAAIAAPGNDQLAAPLERLLALAERDPRRAAQLARARYGEAPQAPFERLALGWALLRWERTAEALALLAGAELALAAAGAHALARRCRYGCLIAQQVAGAGEALQAEWETLVAAHALAGELRAAASARCEQIAHLNLLGRYRAAHELASASHDAIEQHGAPADRARYAHVAGVASAGCGDLDTAAVLLAQASQSFAALGRPVYVARVRFEQAWLQMRRERYQQARVELEQARSAFQRFALPLRVGLCEKDLGYVVLRLGQIGTAIAHTLQARAIFDELGQAALTAACDMNLGVVAHSSGLFELAEAAYARSGAIYADLGAWRYALICGRNQAMILLERGQPGAALALLDQIAAQQHMVGDGMELAEGLAVRARALAASDIPAALACLDAAQMRFAELGNLAAAAECQLDKGWLLLAQAELPDARTCLEAARLVLADRPTQLWRAEYGLGRIAEATGELRAALDRYQVAGQLVAGIRRGLASEHASSAIFAQARHLAADALGLAARLGDGARLLAFAEQQRALALQRQLAGGATTHPTGPALAAAQHRLRALLDAKAAPSERDPAMNAYLEALLHARHNNFSPELPPAPPLDLARLRADLRAAYGDDWTLLAPISVGVELLLVTLTPERLTIDRTPHDAALGELLERACRSSYRLHTYRDLAPLRAGQVATWQTLRALGERLLPPRLRARLHPDHRLLIIPDGPLHALPWAALRLDDAWLAQRAVVELLPALGALRVAAAPLASDASALLVSCASFGGRAAPLPRALESLERAAARWPGPADRLVGPAATRAALLERAAHGELRRYGLLHIATHAQIGSYGLLAHIKLSDDDLLIDEALRLGLGGAVVVLAACSGAAGEILPGDEVLSLGRALLAAGARSVVAGLWQIYDEGTLRLLDPFYVALASGADPALALALAQRALITSERDSADPLAVLASPLVWGSMCVTSVGLARRL